MPAILRGRCREIDATARAILPRYPRRRRVLRRDRRAAGAAYRAQPMRRAANHRPLADKFAFAQTCDHRINHVVNERGRQFPFEHGV